MQGTNRRFLGAFLSEGQLDIRENSLSAIGDTMNGGRIFVHADAGAAAGYAMWGGALYIRGNAGLRAGTHMRAGAVLLIGGSAGDYLGEYQAGGTMVVLGLSGSQPLYGTAPWAGMQGGKAFLRRHVDDLVLPSHIFARPAQDADIEQILPHLSLASQQFGWDLQEILTSAFTLLTPKSQRPYKAMYTPV